MTDYAQASAADPSWTWWMTTAAAAVRLRNLQHHHGDGSGSSDVDDEYAGPGGKRQRVGDVKDDCWRFDRNDRGGLLLRHRLEPDDTASAGPLDLSVKATLTTTTAATATARVAGKRAGPDGYPAATTPEKRPTATATANRGKSSKKTVAGGAAASTTAVKAATRKLLPQLMLDRHVDRSSPVSGTIIVPAVPEDPTTAAGRKRLASSSPSLSSSSSLSSPPYPTAADCGGEDGDPRDDDYDGGDIDPEFNVVVATDEARRQIESIPNALGPYRCRLCGVRYVDAFALARHRCRCIVHVRYTCPECDKVFQCPANLASHRRWHGTGTSVKTTGAGKNGKTGEHIGAKPVSVIASNIVSDTAAIDVNDSDGGSIMSAPAVTPASGFKKNILQRAVQAAAAAAAAANDNNNNDGDNDDNDKKQCNNDHGDIAK